MITKIKLKIFQKSNGDGDMWLRNSWWWQRSKMMAEDWSLISQLIQDIKLMNKGLVSDAYAESVNLKIQENCQNEEAIAKLK